MNPFCSNQVSVQTEYFQPQKKSKHGQHRENYFAFYYWNNREKINRQRRKQYSSKKNKKLTWRWQELFNTPKPYCFNCSQVKISPYWLNYCGQSNCPVITWLENKKKEQIEKEGWFYDFQTKIALANLTPKIGRKKEGKNKPKNSHGVRRKIDPFSSHTHSSLEHSHAISKELFFIIFPNH